MVAGDRVVGSICGIWGLGGGLGEGLVLREEFRGLYTKVDYGASDLPHILVLEQ